MFLILKDGRGMTVRPETGVLLWNVLQGHLKGSPEQIIKAKQVEKFYFNRSNPSTPKDWLALHPAPAEEVSQANGKQLWWQD